MVNFQLRRLGYLTVLVAALAVSAFASQARAIEVESLLAPNTLFLDNDTNFNARFDSSTPCSTAVGDISGDGIDDLIVGACKARGEGAVYIVYGGNNTDKTDGQVDFNSLNPEGDNNADETRLRELEEDADVTIQGGYSGGEFGNSVAVNGDFNGDGRDDLAVGAPNNPGDCPDARPEDILTFGISRAIKNSCKTGAVVIFYGGSDLFDDSTVDLGSQSIKDNHDNDFIEIKGNSANTVGGDFGTSISFSKDQNGDERDELVASDPDYSSTGAAWVVFGMSSSAPDLMVGTDYRGTNPEIADFNSDKADSCEGDYPGEASCSSGATLGITGDVGDIGAKYTYNVDSSGSSHKIGSIRTMSYGNKPYGYEIDGYVFSVTGGGDINGDGRGDIVLGGRGTASVVYGKPDSSTINLIQQPVPDEVDQFHYSDGTSYTSPGSNLSVSDKGYTIMTPATLSNSGRAPTSVAIVSDVVGGDGLADLLVGASDANDDEHRRAQTGQAYIIPGRSGTEQGDISMSDPPDDVSVISGPASGSNFGESIASLGDIDHDGLTDVLVSAPHASGSVLAGALGLGAVGDLLDGEAGAVYVIYGQDDNNRGIDFSVADSPNGNGVDATDATPTGSGKRWAAILGASGCKLTVSLAPLGIVCKSGSESGDHLGGGIGPSFVGFGSDYWGQQQVAAGDLNGDGTPDLALNAPNLGHSGGASYVVLGPDISYRGQKFCPNMSSGGGSGTRGVALKCLRQGRDYTWKPRLAINGNTPDGDDVLKGFSLTEIITSSGLSSDDVIAAISGDDEAMGRIGDALSQAFNGLEESITNQLSGLLSQALSPAYVTYERIDDATSPTEGLNLRLSDGAWFANSNFTDSTDEHPYTAPGCFSAGMHGVYRMTVVTPLGTDSADVKLGVQGDPCVGPEDPVTDTTPTITDSTTTTTGDSVTQNTSSGSSGSSGSSSGSSGNQTTTNNITNNYGSLDCKLSGVKTQALRKKRLLVYAKCNDKVSLKASGKLSTPKKLRRLKTGTRSRSAEAEQTRMVILKLSTLVRKRIKAQLRKKKVVKAKVSVVFTSTTQGSITKTKTIRIR